MKFTDYLWVVGAILVLIVLVLILAKLISTIWIRDLRKKKREKRNKKAEAEGKPIQAPVPERPLIKEVFFSGMGDSQSSLGTEFSNSSCENISSPGLIVGASPGLEPIEVQN